MNHNLLISALLLLSVAILSSCVSVINPYEGKTVSESNIIPLKRGGPHEGSWNTKQVSFDYSYTHQQPNAINISGEIFCHEASYWTLEIVDSLIFRISFIDSDAKLIENRILWTRGVDNFTYQWHVSDRTVELPPNTAAIGFSYLGSVREAGGTTPGNGGEGIQIDLWYSPLGE